MRGCWELTCGLVTAYVLGAAGALAQEATLDQRGMLTVEYGGAACRTPANCAPSEGQAPKGGSPGFEDRHLGSPGQVSPVLTPNSDTLRQVRTTHGLLSRCLSSSVGAVVSRTA